MMNENNMEEMIQQRINDEMGLNPIPIEVKESD